uniref:Vomeronasal type-1 receptor n=1 Tax=Sciurus vulgaris TaxID=55149 RepID=A0A8D2DM26_SCIVU
MEPQTPVTVGIILLSQTVVGVLGNSSLLLHYLVLYFTRCRVRHTDLILQHLIVANLLNLLCRGIPQTVSAFTLKYFLSDIGCKLLFTLHRVGRGVSTYSTCLLSIFQAITNSSGNSRWAELKVKAPRYIDSFACLSWILYLLLNALFPMYVSGNRNSTNFTSLKGLGYCLMSFLAAFLTLPDAMFVGLKLWTSSSMVLILHRHKSSSESRATKTILALVSTFVSFYTLSCIFHCWLTLISNPKWFVVHMGAIVTGCFPAASPFLLLSQDFRFCFTCSVLICFLNKSSTQFFM